jgi:hypothetical protein
MATGWSAGRVRSTLNQMIHSHSHGGSQTRWIFAVALLACLALSVVCVVYPIYVIRPFRGQGARELAVALVLSRFRGVLTLLSAFAAVWAAVAYWHAQARIWRRVLVAAGATLVCILAVLARVNVYELMFHPVDHPEFSAASGVTLDKNDKLVTVRIGGSARAYPIRTMGYHHIVNDLVGGTAIVATY